MQTSAQYLDDFVSPTVSDFEANPTSIRHAFLACVAVFHSIDYFTFPKSSRTLREKFRRESEDFKLADDVAHAFKHIVAGNPVAPRLTQDQVVEKVGAFEPGAFSTAFEVGAVTLNDNSDVNLLTVVKHALEFVRHYEAEK